MNFLANPILGAFLWVRILWTSLVAQTVKNLSAMQETQVLFLGQEDPLEKEMATHSTILAWRIPGTEEISGYKIRSYSCTGYIQYPVSKA